LAFKRKAAAGKISIAMSSNGNLIELPKAYAKLGPCDFNS